MKDLDRAQRTDDPEDRSLQEQRLLLKYGTSTPNDFGKVYILPRRHRRTGRRRSKALSRKCSKTRNCRRSRKGPLEIDPIDRQDHTQAGDRVSRHVPSDFKNKLADRIEDAR